MSETTGTSLRVYLDLEYKFAEVFPDEDPKAMLGGQVKAIGVMPKGMSSGKPSVGFMIMTSEGRTVYAETSLKNLQMAVAMFIQEFGDMTDGEWRIQITKDGLVTPKREM